MKYKNRIKEYRLIPAADIDPHPMNFQVHGPEQTRAMQEVLESIGWADAVLVFETGNGRYSLIDGELRQGMDDEVPALVLDLDDEESNALLAQHDPIAAMASQDAEKMQALIDVIDEAAADLLKMQVGISAAKGTAADPTEKQRATAEAMELKPYEHYDYVVVLARTTTEFNRLVERLGLKVVSKEKSQSRVGLCRAIPAKQLLELLDGRPMVDPPADEDQRALEKMAR